MSPRRTAHRPLAPLALAVAVLAGCGTSTPVAGPPGPTDGATTTTTPRVELDPERYVKEYRSVPTDAGTTGAVPNTSEAPAPPLPDPPPTIDEDNTFVDAGEQPFVVADDEPTSTFGLDVDTGSATVGRTFLAEGQRPPADSVRTEEWVNALGSAQEAPARGDLGLAVDGARAPFTDDTSLLVRIGVAGRDVDPQTRPPAHLTFVVDTSGSMDIRERLGLVKASLGLLVLNLRDDDTISIVTYSDDAGVILEPTAVSDAQTIVDAIDELRPGGSTNLEGGLRSGYEQANAAFDPDGINAVILASDGVANVGLTDPDGLAGEIQDQAAEGVHLVTVGYGMGNYNDDLMEQVADQGDGFYAYLDTYAQAERLFGDALTSNLVVVAGDAKAQVTFDPALVDRYRLVGYENRQLDAEDFDDDTVDAGEVGAGHRVTALYEVRLLPTYVEPAADAILGTAAVRYRSTASGEVVTIEADLTYGAVSGGFDAAPADLRLQAAAATFAQWLGDGKVVGERGTDLAEVAPVAEAAAAELPAAGLPGSLLTPDDLVELIEMARTASPPVADPGD